MWTICGSASKARKTTTNRASRNALIKSRQGFQLFLLRQDANDSRLTNAACSTFLRAMLAIMAILTRVARIASGARGALAWHERIAMCSDFRFRERQRACEYGDYGEQFHGR